MPAKMFNSRGATAEQKRRRLLHIPTGKFMHQGGETLTDKEDQAWFGFPSQATSLITRRNDSPDDWLLISRTRWAESPIADPNKSNKFI